MSLKGILLCGGSATRLEELTRENGGTNKHLLRVGEKPMIYYPLEMLSLAGITEICLISSQDHAGKFIDLLGAGKVCKRNNPEETLFDLDITYRVQAIPGGIAQAIALAENFANNQPVVVALGDNIIQGNIITATQNFIQNPDKARILLKDVKNPKEYGVAIFDDKKNIIDIIEKPKSEPTSNMAAIGIYFLPADVFQIIKKQKPSDRGELEITDVNKYYLQQNRLEYDILSGWWEDAGQTAFGLDEIGVMIKKTGANRIQV